MKDILTSKLLSDLLDKEVSGYEIHGNYIYVYGKYLGNDLYESDEISIHELQHIAKEKALDKDIVIKSFKEHSGDCFAVLSSGIILDFHDEAKSCLWQSEYGAVLKAYAWIKENIK